MTKTKAARAAGPDGVGQAGADGPSSWVPEAARVYLAHTEGGRTIRALAREEGVHPSTILRQVRKVEVARDDPLVDAALRQLSGRPLPAPGGEGALLGRAVPALRRLSESGTVLAVARDMDKGVILRERPGADPQRLLVVDGALAESMALREWIACPQPDSRIRRYRITPRGQEVLRRALQRGAGRGLAEAPSPFLREPPEEDARLRHLRSLMPETPLQSLSRRRDGEGQPFLGRDLMAAGERLREDFDLARGAGPDWEEALDAIGSGRAVPPVGEGAAASAAERVLHALSDLGPGLADVALRCCCMLEGLEIVERRMGWSSRSGKIVLRIALLRLQQHYREVGDGMIG